MEEKENEEFEIDFNKILSFVKSKKKIMIYSLLIILLLAAGYSRTRNIPNLQGKYLLSPDDPYVFLRYSLDIANGHLPKNDTLRYYPIGFPTSKENLFMAYLAGYTYKIANSINPSISMYDIAAYLTPLLFVISLVIFFFLTKEIFNDEIISLISTGFLAFSIALLQRTSAGFLEKEPIFLPMFLAAMFFFIKSYKKDKHYLYATLSGIFTGLAAFASGLFIFIMLFISMFFAIETFFERINKRKLYKYLIWLMFSIIVTSILTTKYGGFSIKILKTVQFQIPLIVAVFGIVSTYIKKPKIFEKIPNKFFYLLITICIAIAGGFILLGASSFVKVINMYYTRISTPYGATSRFTSSVSENQPPVFYSKYGSSWWTTFGLPLRIGGISINTGVFFIMFFIGAILLFYETFKKYNYGKHLTYAFALFSLALVFENFSNRSYHWVNILFSQQWVFALIFVIVGLIFVLKNKDLNELKGRNILILVWYIISIMAANGAVRLFFIMAFPAAILSAYFIKWCTNWLSKHAKKYDLIPYLFSALVIIVMFFVVSQANAYMNPNLGIWYESMDWIKENTPEDAIFTHWWDYGYLVQALGNRATIGDPGNFHVERNYDIGGHVFNAFNSSEIVWFANKYKFYGKDAYLLIPSEDILKFVQIARLGSLSENAYVKCFP